MPSHSWLRLYKWSTRFRRDWTRALAELKTVVRLSWTTYRHASSAWRTARRLTAESTPPTRLAAVGLPIFTVGAMYLVLCAPLAWVSAVNLGDNPVSVLLLQQFPKGVYSGRLTDWIIFPHLAGPGGRVFMFALGAYWGAWSVTIPLMILSGGMVSGAISSVGLLLGYTSTYALADLTQILPPSSGLRHLSILRFWYIMLTFLAAKSLISLFGGKGFPRAKYEFLFRGSHALFSGWILERGFHEEAAIFSGALYLFVTFIAMSVTERLLTPILLTIRHVPGAHKVWDLLQTERTYSFRGVIVGCKKAWREERTIVVLLTLGFGCWPLFLGSVLKLMF